MIFGCKKSVLPMYLLFVFVWLSTSCSFAFAFQPFELIRRETDIFENPTVKQCNYQGAGYCTDRNAVCAWADRNGCCYCLCGYGISTFDTSILKCRANTYFRTGCNLRFVNVYSGQPLKILDLSRNGKAKVALKTGQNVKVKCTLKSVQMFMRDGRILQDDFMKNLISVGKVNKDGDVDIKWRKANQKNYGNIFKVNIICGVETKKKQKGIKLVKSDCFVFKSLGTFTVFPLLPPFSTSLFSQPMRKTSLASLSDVVPTVLPTLFPTVLPTLFPPVLPAVSSFQPVKPGSVAATPVLPAVSSFQPVKPGSVEATPVFSPNILMTTTGLETATSPNVAVPSVPVTLTMTTKGFEVNGKGTTKEQPIMPSSTTYIAATSSNYYVDPNAGKRSGGNNKIVVISSAVVVCVLIILAICLFLLWSRKRNGKTPAQRQNHTAGLCSGDATAHDNNAMGMNQVENIYAEADHVLVNSNCVSEKGNHVYEYAHNTTENNYTSLDKTILEENNDYQALQQHQQMYERISAKKSSPSEVRANGQPSVTTGPGNKHDERVYSVIEDANNPESTAPPVSEVIYRELDDSRPGNKQDEQVYSVLDEDDNESKTTEVSPVSQPIYHEPDNNRIADDISGRVPHVNPGNENNEGLYSVLEETGNERAVSESDYVTVLPETSDYEIPFDVSNT